MSAFGIKKTRPNADNVNGYVNTMYAPTDT